MSNRSRNAGDPKQQQQQENTLYQTVEKLQISSFNQTGSYNEGEESIQLRQIRDREDESSSLDDNEVMLITAENEESVSKIEPLLVSPKIILTGLEEIQEEEEEQPEKLSVKPSTLVLNADLPSQSESSGYFSTCRFQRDLLGE